MPPPCGNGIVDFGENAIGQRLPATNSAPATSTARAVFCGDGLTNAPAGEVCDDGASNGDPCAYGNNTCTRCNSTCTGNISPGGPFCGDSVVNGPEVCDQGDLVNGSQCAYNDATCLTGLNSTICKASCDGFVPNPNGPFCGDAIIQTQFNEQCDPQRLPPANTATCDSTAASQATATQHARRRPGRFQYRRLRLVQRQLWSRHARRGDRLGHGAGRKRA